MTRYARRRLMSRTDGSPSDVHRHQPETDTASYYDPSRLPPRYDEQGSGQAAPLTPFQRRPDSEPESSRRLISTFKPMVLLQQDHGDGVPFIRGYSGELLRRGITEQEFLTFVDVLNTTRAPNPEMQIFQKTAVVASFFV